ncbi:ATP-dependent DNA helicase PIF1-like protein [Tanacetum coccineum]|uniref:ATP-dependent DNA helicase n=1 Tax=Tanacetum coccineum TaxID=301880 RepID=A0ABQ5ANC7_9ASTR
MVHRHCFDAFDRTLRDIATGTHNNSTDKVFGGKVIVFGGDFRQILPVIPNNTRQDVIHASLNKSYLWDHCTVLKLTENMCLRVGCNPGDADSIKEFVEWIMSIGDGKIGGKNDGYAEVKFPQDMLIPDSDDHLSIQPKTVGRERPKEDFLHHGAGNLLCKGHAIWLGLKNAGATYQRAMTAIFHDMIHVGLDLVETRKPAETVDSEKKEAGASKLEKGLSQTPSSNKKDMGYGSLLSFQAKITSSYCSRIVAVSFNAGTFIGAVGKNTGLFLFSIVRKRSLVSHVPYVPSRYSHDSPLHLFSATVGSDLSRVRSLHSTRSLSFKGIPFLAMKSICASAVLTYEQAVQGLTWRTAFLTEE